MSGQMRKTERQHRAEIVAVGRRMYERGYIAGTDGNVSVRLPGDRVLATPAGLAKGDLDPSDLVVTDLNGELVGPSRGSGRRPSSEMRVHLAAYRLRPDIQAVVHAHPPAAVAHSLAGVSLEPIVIPETVAVLGRIAGTDYGTPGTPELAERMEDALSCHDAVLMERHGTVTLGGDLMQAYHRLESLEHTAQILFMARGLGKVQPLPTDEVERLYQQAEGAGVRWRFRGGADCGLGDVSEEALVEAVVEKVLKALGR